MAIAGNNIKVKIWRISYLDDDSVGGAVITGSVVGIYPARLQANPEEQLLLQQGLETERIFKVNIVPGYLDILERDELEVIAPTDHVYYGKWFRVRGVSYSSLNKRDPRNYMMLTISRSVRAHSLTSLYDRILSLNPTLYHPLGDTTTPLIEARFNGANINAIEATSGLLGYAQTGCGDGRKSLFMNTGTVAAGNTAYSSFVTSNTKLTSMMWIKFASPFLAGTSSWMYIFTEPNFGGANYLQMTHGSVANSIDIYYKSQKITKTGVDYNWHCWAWTLDQSLSRFRAYYDGALIQEITTSTTLPYATSSDMFIGNSASVAAQGYVQGYFQHHALWIGKELSLEEIEKVSKIWYPA